MTDIVQDDQMPGEPRLGGRDITVYHVVTAIEELGGIDEAAEQLRIGEQEVETPLEWTRNHPDEVGDAREEHRE